MKAMTNNNWKKEGYLGPHSPILKSGNVQSMVFKSGDVGPF